MNLEDLIEIRKLNIHLLNLVDTNLNRINEHDKRDLLNIYNQINIFWSQSSDILFSLYSENKIKSDIENLNDKVFDLYDDLFLESGFQLSDIKEVLLRILMCTTYLHQYEDIDFKSNLFSFVDFLENRLNSMAKE